MPSRRKPPTSQRDAWARRGTEIPPGQAEIEPAWSATWRTPPEPPDPGAPAPRAPDTGPADTGPAGTSPADPETAARQICLRLLILEPRTRSQLADALRRRHVPGPVAEAVLGRFTAAGLIDDPAFARAWVESRHHSRGLSRRALSAELHRRGLADDDIHEAIELVDDAQEAAMARQLVAARTRSTRGQPAATRVRKLMGVLARKGYGPALAYRVVREALEAEGAEIAEAVAEPDPDIGPDDFMW